MPMHSTHKCEEILTWSLTDRLSIPVVQWYSHMPARQHSNRLHNARWKSFQFQLSPLDVALGVLPPDVTSGWVSPPSFTSKRFVFQMEGGNDHQMSLAKGVWYQWEEGYPRGDSLSML